LHFSSKPICTWKPPADADENLADETAEDDVVQYIIDEIQQEKKRCQD
jgi:hypothetical protein